MFNVLYHLNEQEIESFYSRNHSNTAHVAKRSNRMKHIDLNAVPVPGFSAIVDKGHRNGEEVHMLFSDGSVRIFNINSGKLVTILIARPAQVFRIRKNYSDRIPRKVWNIIKSNVDRGLNYS